MPMLFSSMELQNSDWNGTYLDDVNYPQDTASN